MANKLLDQNALITMNNDPRKLDIHQMALVKAGVNIDPSAKHDFLRDRARQKKIKNIDELFEKLNEMERSGVLDIWIKKFGKKKYLKEVASFSTGIALEEQKIVFNLNKDLFKKKLLAIQETGIASSGAVATSSAPIASYGGQAVVRNRYMPSTKVKKRDGDVESKN